MLLLKLFTCMSRWSGNVPKDIATATATATATTTTRSSTILVPELPNDIILDILSRLPADNVLRCRTVCKTWLALTSSSNFAEIHLKRVKSVDAATDTIILVQSICEPILTNKLGLLMLSTECKRLCKSIHHGFVQAWPGGKLWMEASCDGLLVFRTMYNGSRYLVCNLVTKDQFVVEAPVQEHPTFSAVNAIFVHPRTGEYNMLFSCRHESPQKRLWDFYVYSFKSQSWRKVSTSKYMPKYFSNPVILNDTLHWMTLRHYANPVYNPPCNSSIVTFDTSDEELRAMPHPGDSCGSSQPLHKYMWLFERAGSLRFCSVVSRVVSIWVLEDYRRWSWAKQHSIDLGDQISDSARVDSLSFVTVENGQLMLWFLEKMFIIDLNKPDRSVIVLTKKMMEKHGVRLDAAYFNTMSYTKSFVRVERPT